MSKQFSIPRGTSDILPSQVTQWQDLEAKARRILATYSFSEIRTPIFEQTSLFKRSLGQTSDVVNKQLLELVSPGKEEGFALRPEGTASVVRSYIENSMDRQEGISKLFYIGPMFRGERPQKGRLRQFHQIGVEVIGANTATPYLDAEVIALNVELLKVLGVKDFRLKLNTLGSPQDKEHLSKALRNALQPDVQKLCEDCQDRFERNVFRILDCKNSDCRAIVAKVHLGHGHLSAESQKYYAELKNILKDLKVEFEEVPTLVRGLDYYTHTVFEITQSSLGSQDTISAGGRYNDLVEQLGGPKVDAVGFACGIERTILAIPEIDRLPIRQPVEFFFVNLNQEYTNIIFQKVQMVRQIIAKESTPSMNLICDMSYTASSMKSQLRLANKLNAHYVIILGENEVKDSRFAIKNMSIGEQFDKSFADFDMWVTDTILERVKK